MSLRMPDTNSAVHPCCFSVWQTMSHLYPYHTWCSVSYSTERKLGRAGIDESRSLCYLSAVMETTNTKSIKSSNAERTCKCGCGGHPKTMGAKYLPGHDAKLGSMRLEAKRTGKTLKAVREERLSRSKGKRKAARKPTRECATA